VDGARLQWIRQRRDLTRRELGKKAGALQVGTAALLVRR
jgi:transcriptional regulator with XRE-family HTH domain